MNYSSIMTYCLYSSVKFNNERSIQEYNLKFTSLKSIFINKTSIFAIK